MSIKKELIEFKKFRENYNFNFLNLTYKDDIIFYNDILITDKEGNTLNEGDEFINVGYKLKGAKSKLLSNLYPYEFKFRGKKVYSIESVFQGIKFKDIKEQNLVLKYSGLPAVNIKGASDYDWKETGIVYWQGKGINRFSNEYQDFVDELYISAIQNPLYRKAIRNTDKYILHSLGNMEEKETVFTRYEFERMLNALKEFLNRE